MSVLAALVAACGEPEDPYVALPRLERSVALTVDGDTLEPARVQMLADTLWVAYRNEPRLDAYDLSLNLVASVPLIDPEPVRPTSFAITDSAIYACDHSRQLIVVYDRTGAYRTSFGRLPDGTTQLSPLALTYFGGVLYVADMSERRILAVSMADAEGITETGELILTIPGSEAPPIGFPSAVLVTPDGRLLVGDAEASVIRVFTCDGRPIYDFERVPGMAVMSPQAMARDRVTDPSMKDDRSFDPSGLREQGRYHVVDSHSGRVHLFNPLGRYLGSYPEAGSLTHPSGIAIDRAGDRIFVADPPARRIHVFRTKEA